MLLEEGALIAPLRQEAEEINLEIRTLERCIEVSNDALSANKRRLATLVRKGSLHDADRMGQLISEQEGRLQEFTGNLAKAKEKLGSVSEKMRDIYAKLASPISEGSTRLANSIEGNDMQYRVIRQCSVRGVTYFPGNVISSGVLDESEVRSLTILQCIEIGTQNNNGDGVSPQSFHTPEVPVG